jgi:hypothetical protein
MTMFLKKRKESFPHFVQTVRFTSWRIAYECECSAAFTVRFATRRLVWIKCPIVFAAERTLLSNVACFIEKWNAVLIFGKVTLQDAMVPKRLTNHVQLCKLKFEERFKLLTPSCKGHLSYASLTRKFASLNNRIIVHQYTCRKKPEWLRHVTR